MVGAFDLKFSMSTLTYILSLLDALPISVLVRSQLPIAVQVTKAQAIDLEDGLVSAGDRDLLGHGDPPGGGYGDARGAETGPAGRTTAVRCGPAAGDRKGVVEGKRGERGGRGG